MSFPSLNMLEHGVIVIIGIVYVILIGSYLTHIENQSNDTKDKGKQVYLQQGPPTLVLEIYCPASFRCIPALLT